MGSSLAPDNGAAVSPQTAELRTADLPPEPLPSASEAIAEADPESTPESTPETGFGPVLRNRNFLLLWLGQLFSQVADKIYLVLMIALITSEFQTVGQTVSGWVSSVMIAFTVPAVLFGSVAGVFVDRRSKKQLLVLTNFLRGGLVMAVPLLLWLAQGWGTFLQIPLGFWMLLGVTFGVSTLTQFFAPAEQSVIPLIVERQHLLSANSLYTLTMMLAVILGFAAGEPLLSVANQMMAHWSQHPEWGQAVAVGGSYAIAGGLLCLIVTGESQKHHTPSTQHVWRDIREGVSYLKQQPQVRGALIQLVILFSIIAALAVLVVRLAEVLPTLKASQFGFLLAAGGVGMAIGVAFLGQIGQQFVRRRLSLYGSIGMAVMLGGISCATHHLVTALILLVGLGFFASLAGVPMQTTIQEKTPEEMRGKVFGLQNNAVNIALSLPLALAGLAETWLGLQTVFLSLAILVILGGVLSWFTADVDSH
nr:MFS transporter [Petrachloros mirabilis]